MSARGPTRNLAAAILRPIPEAIGGLIREAISRLIESIIYLGGICRLLYDVIKKTTTGFVSREGGRLHLAPFVTQMVRFGVKSVPIVMLVQMFIGLILALNLAPTLESYGQLNRVADVVGLAVFRELGPLITAVILSGFAGASIAAEIGAMVEGEEIKALRAHALDPVKFLVIPRVIATTVMMIGLTIIADVFGLLGGLVTGMYVLDLSFYEYVEGTRLALKTSDYTTGLIKGAVFGVIISTLACYLGLNVKGGAAGVGEATTRTVVHSIVSLIAADVVFTVIFYVLNV
ncbi:MAG: MlaE family ABC transporter permease [Phycisphaerae bacterium]